MRFPGRLAGLFDGALIAQDHQAAGQGKVHRQRLDRENVNPAAFYSPVSRLGLGEKGVLGKASKA